MATKTPAFPPQHASEADGAQDPVQYLVARIREAIVSGRLFPNERLVEGEIADRFSTNRAAVRAALIELRGEGLVEREANRGARVHAVSLREAIEIAQVRRPLEGICAGMAAERATEDERDELRALIAEVERALADGDVMRYSALNNEFHLRIYEISHHEIASSTAIRLRNLASRIRFRTALVPGRPAVAVPEHRVMMEAIVAGDAAAAAAAAEAHFTSMLEVLQSLDESEFL